MSCLSVVLKRMLWATPTPPPAGGQRSLTPHPPHARPRTHTHPRHHPPIPIKFEKSNFESWALLFFAKDFIKIHKNRIVLRVQVGHPDCSRKEKTFGDRQCIENCINTFFYRYLHVWQSEFPIKKSQIGDKSKYQYQQ